MPSADSTPVPGGQQDAPERALVSIPPPRLSSGLTSAALVGAAALGGAAPPPAAVEAVVTTEAVGEPSIQQALEALRHTQSCVAVNAKKTRQAFDSITAAGDSGVMRTTRLRKRA